MNSGKKANALLVEILISLLFFLLAATVLIRIFAAASELALRSKARTLAMAQAQNVADTLILAENEEEREAALKEMSFTNSHGTWVLDCGDFTVRVTGEETPSGNGVLWEGEVGAFRRPANVQTLQPEAEELITLPCVSYTEVQG